MAKRKKKEEIEEVIPRPHQQCKHCREIDYEFLSHLGQPIMGECIYSEKRFLLNEKTTCNEYNARFIDRLSK